MSGLSRSTSPRDHRYGQAARIPRAVHRTSLVHPRRRSSLGALWHPAPPPSMWIVAGIGARTTVSGMSCGNASPCSPEHPVRTVVLLSAIDTVSPATVTATLGVPPHD